MEKFDKAITIDSMTSKSSKLTGSTAATSTSFMSTVGKTPASSSDPLQILTLKPSQCKAAAMCLADAFSADDVAAYFLDCPDTAGWSKERKWALHLKILEAMTYAHIKCGLAQAIGDPSKKGSEGSFDAVALWMPPGATMDGWSIMLRSGLWRHWASLAWQLSKEGKVRFFKEFIPLLHTTKLEVLKERDPGSWYLVYVGTHSRARGKGLAKRLINDVTRKADVESRATYLESSNVVNVPLYNKLGFETTKTIHLVRGTKDGGNKEKKSVALDIMVREPVAPVLKIKAEKMYGKRKEKVNGDGESTGEIVVDPANERRE